MLLTWQQFSITLICRSKRRRHFKASFTRVAGHSDCHIGLASLLQIIGIFYIFTATDCDSRWLRQIHSYCERSLLFVVLTPFEASDETCRRLMRIVVVAQMSDQMSLCSYRPSSSDSPFTSGQCIFRSRFLTSTSPSYRV